MNQKIIPNFLSEEERVKIQQLILKNQSIDLTLDNIHIKSVAEGLKGKALIYDFTETDISKALVAYQGNNNSLGELDPIFFEIKDKIVKALNIREQHSFVQLVTLAENGSIKPHYDAGIPGYITYKCNVSIQSDNYNFHVGNNILPIEENSLYCFEANLFKHWTLPHTNSRILLSYGFIIPYEELNWEANAPEIRLANRIFSKFQK